MNVVHFQVKKKQRLNQASYFVRGNIGEKLINIPRKVKNREISFVKDTGSDMTLVREDLVDTNCVLQGQTAMLYTAIGQPFNAKLAVVDLETPYYKGYHTVGLVPNLAAEALLGMDVMTKQHTCALAVTRAQSKKYQKSEEEAHIAAEKCGVQPTNISRIEENEQDRIVDSSDEETDMEEDVNMENISNVNAETFSEMQKGDNSINTLPEKILNHMRMLHSSGEITY